MTASPHADRDVQAYLGRTFEGRYRIDALLGVGGMGAVFRAHHLGLGVDVAVKVLRGTAHGQTAEARFRREAKSAARLDHPHCVRVTDFGELDDGAKYIVMELLAGEELEQRLGQPWPPAEAVEIARQVLEGLAHAHARGIVHRDLKPSNVLVLRDEHGRPHVKLVDFGIAKIVEGEGAQDELTRTGMSFGTPAYMSPEQAGGSPADARSDLYAVGLLLYEMLAGRPPFESNDLAALLRMHILTDPPPLPESVPPPLAAVVLRLLQKSRKDRYDCAAATLEALAAADADAGATPVPPPPAPVFQPVMVESNSFHDGRPPTRGGTNPATARAIAIALVAIGVLVVVTYFAIGGPPAPGPATTAVAEPAAEGPVTAPPGRASSPIRVAGGADTCRGEACGCEKAESCDRTCTEACELECPGSTACNFTCGDDCAVDCKGKSACELDVGDGSSVKCGGKGQCTVTCRGRCTVSCKGKSDCSLRCLDPAAAGPVECGKDKYGCGAC